MFDAAKIIIENEYHIFQLMNNCTPAFVSLKIEYIATLEEYKDFINAGYEQYPDEYFLMLRDAFDKYIHGKKLVKIHLGYNDTWFAAPVTVIAQNTFHAKKMDFLFYNLYEYEHEMRADTVDVNIIYVKTEKDEYIRAIKPNMVNAKYKDIFTKDYDSLADRNYWGHPGLIFSENNTLKSRVYLIEKRFKNEEDCINDIKEPSPLKFDRFFLEIFGDG